MDMHDTLPPWFFESLTFLVTAKKWDLDWSSEKELAQEVIGSVCLSDLWFDHWGTDEHGNFFSECHQFNTLTSASLDRLCEALGEDSGWKVTPGTCIPGQTIRITISPEE